MEDKDEKIAALCKDLNAARRSAEADNATITELESDRDNLMVMFARADASLSVLKAQLSRILDQGEFETLADAAERVTRELAEVKCRLQVIESAGEALLGIVVGGLEQDTLRTWAKDGERDGHYAIFAGFESAINASDFGAVYGDLDIYEQIKLFAFVTGLLEPKSDLDGLGARR